MDWQPRAARSLPSGYPRVVDGVEARGRHAGPPRGGFALRVGLLQRDTHQAVGLLLHSLLRNRRPLMSATSPTRLAKRLLKVLKALADYHDLSLGDLIESIA